MSLLFGAPFVQVYLHPLVFAVYRYRNSWEKPGTVFIGFSNSGSAIHNVKSIETYTG